MANETVRAILDSAKKEGRASLTSQESKAVAEAYNIAMPKEGLANGRDEAASIASEIGFPVVMKIVSPEILHKTDAGGVVIGVADSDSAAHAYDQIIDNANNYNADATIVGVQIQQQVGDGQEVIVGAVTDPVFGKLVAFGLGGTLVEVLRR